jgi:hypothetical protein
MLNAARPQPIDSQPWKVSKPLAGRAPRRETVGGADYAVGTSANDILSHLESIWPNRWPQPGHDATVWPQSLSHSSDRCLKNARG